MQFTRLEQDILRWVAERADTPALIAQLNGAEPVSREHTGAGFFVQISVPPETVPLSGEEWSRSHIDGPAILSPGLEYGGDSILWITEGRINCLEVYAYGGSFPKELEDYRLAEGMPPQAI